MENDTKLTKEFLENISKARNYMEKADGVLAEAEEQETRLSWLVGNITCPNTDLCYPEFVLYFSEYVSKLENVLKGDRIYE